MKEESGNHLVVFKNSDFLLAISLAAFLSAGVILRFFIVLCEVASLGSYMIVTVFLSAGVAICAKASCAPLGDATVGLLANCSWRLVDC